VEVVAPGVEVGHDGVAVPVAVPVGDVAPVAVGKEFRVVALVGRPLARPRANANLDLVVHGQAR
jgi:hypothetical protein